VVAVATYPFAGFFAPVNNLSGRNQARAGSAIPVKFSLGGDRGLAICAAGSPKSEQVACDSTALVDGIDRRHPPSCPRRAAPEVTLRQARADEAPLSPRSERRHACGPAPTSTRPSRDRVVPLHADNPALAVPPAERRMPPPPRPRDAPRRVQQDHHRQSEAATGTYPTQAAGSVLCLDPLRAPCCTTALVGYGLTRAALVFAALDTCSR